jgi:hypothetical protein
MDNDTNGLARLAIRLYSIITNSGASECNFSDFGNIQTKKRSRLSVEKTHKINIVRMDIRRRHASLGLLKCRSKCKLGNDDEPTVDESSDAEDDSFEAVAQNLIGLANDNAAADADAAADDISAAPAAATLNLQGTHRRSRTQIPLATLFDFTRLDNGLDFYWKGAIKNLDAEADALELAFVQQEGLQVPGMPDASSIASSSLV